MSDLPTGKIIGLPNDEYHACEAISHSKLEKFRERASRYYRLYVSHQAEKEDKDCYDEGNAAHTLILEGDAEYAKHYAVMPEGLRRGTKAFDAFTASAPSGSTMLTANQDKLSHSLRDSVRRHAVATAILSDPGFIPEVTWRVKLYNGIYIQCRTDGFIEHITEATAKAIVGMHAVEGQTIIADLKSCGTLNEDEQGSFQKAIENYGYHRQEAWYRMIVSEVLGRQPDHFIFIAPEKSEPFETLVGALPPDAVQIGVDENLESFRALVQCFRSGCWDGVAQGHIVQIDLPEWYKKKADARRALNESL